MNLEYDPQALEDLRHWKRADNRKLNKILRLIEDIKLIPFAGMGKPEPLRHKLAGCWSRRIDKEHRLVYKVEGKSVVILSCRYHYA